MADVARICSSNGAAGKAVCRVLKTCVLQMLLDDGENNFGVDVDDANEVADVDIGLDSVSEGRG